MASQGSKIPDYVLVIKEDNLSQINFYLDTLKELGFTYENESGKTVDLIFIKVFISEEALKHFSQLYEIGSQDYWVTDVFYTESIFAAPFKNPIANNAPFLIGEISNAEKIMVVNRLLENAKYGEKDQEFGLTKLLQLGIIETAYPLHDGPSTDTGTNIRSLLHRYWSNASVAHLPQPLDLIFQYFGNEVAFYFAWLEYFNIMLAIPAVLGAIAFLSSLLYLLYGNPVEVKEICEGEEVMCPTCEGHKGCSFKKLYNFCLLAQWSYVFDNNFTVAYAVFISFWTTLFVTLWRRKENKLKLRWNCVHDVRETEIRQAYLDKATRQQQNRISGEMELYLSKRKTAFHYTVTLTACGILFGVVILVVMVNMVIKILFLQSCNSSHNKYMQSHAKLLTMVLGSMVQVCFMKLFNTFYGPASVRLTRFENPRTQFDFDHSVLYKSYLLCFMNNYVPMIYIAFLKGSFITVPHNMTFMRKDSCQPCNCIVALVVQLTFIMTINTLLGNIFNALLPQFKTFFWYLRKICCHKSQRTLISRHNLSQWEEEYYLEPLFRYSVTQEFSEMVIRYGFVSFFSKAFPLGALCALLNNLIELRSDAYKFVKTHRRPVPIAKSGIGAWNGILRSLSYFSTAMNAFVIAFTSDWVPREVYRINQGDGRLHGYVNSTLSKYATADHEIYRTVGNYTEFCYFRGHYYPPESRDKYLRTQTYWMDLTFRFVTVFVFEHILLLCNAILAYVIPFQTESVKLQLQLNTEKRKEAQLTDCETKLQKTLKTNLDLSKSLQGLQR